MTRAMLPDDVVNALQTGQVIPATPLALDSSRRFDERRQRALARYYVAAGAGGLAVGVHTTQFNIRDPANGLFEPVVTLMAEELDRATVRSALPLVRIGGVCGKTPQAVAEASLLRDRGYHAALLSLAALRNDDDRRRLDHCRAVSEVLPLVGFYLQRSVGGPYLSPEFWRGFVEIPGVVAIKVAPFNRYQTIDVFRAVVESGRHDIALYTGNDDQILLDLLTPFALVKDGQLVVRRFVGGLLGQWAVWTQRAVEILEACHRSVASNQGIAPELLNLAVPLTDANAVIFDAAHDFEGCIPGIHEVLRRQGLLEGTWCLDPHETLSQGQAAEIDRVCRDYPFLADDVFVKSHLDEWLSG